MGYTTLQVIEIRDVLSKKLQAEAQRSTVNGQSGECLETE
jgi:hypothetical protein